MRKNKFLSVMAVALAAVQLISASTVTVQASTLTGAVETDDFIRGVDVSTLDMLEDLGAQYYQNNVANDALTILHNNGAN